MGLINNSFHHKLPLGVDEHRGIGWWCAQVGFLPLFHQLLWNILKCFFFFSFKISLPVPENCFNCTTEYNWFLLKTLLKKQAPTQTWIKIRYLLCCPAFTKTNTEAFFYRNNKHREKVRCSIQHWKTTKKQKCSLHFPLLCADVENCEEKWGETFK